jgi:hypothetical protein
LNAICVQVAKSRASRKVLISQSSETISDNMIDSGVSQIGLIKEIDIKFAQSIDKQVQDNEYRNLTANNAKVIRERRTDMVLEARRQLAMYSQHAGLLNSDRIERESDFPKVIISQLISSSVNP